MKQNRLYKFGIIILALAIFFLNLGFQYNIHKFTYDEFSIKLEINEYYGQEVINEILEKDLLSFYQSIEALNLRFLDSTLAVQFDDEGQLDLDALYYTPADIDWHVKLQLLEQYFAIYIFVLIGLFVSERNVLYIHENDGKQKYISKLATV